MLHPVEVVGFWEPNNNIAALIVLLSWFSIHILILSELFRRLPIVFSYVVYDGLKPPTCGL